MKGIKIKRLGIFTSVGELRKILKKYEDDVCFGFRNQPIQELCEINYYEDKYVVFQKLEEK